MSLICGRTDRIDGGDIYHNEDIIEISIVARVVDGIQAVRRLIVDSITTRTGQESQTSPPSSGERRVISSHAERKKKSDRASFYCYLAMYLSSSPARRKLYSRKMFSYYIDGRKLS